jgi:putative long chain acyl-CoA synthase
VYACTPIHHPMGIALCVGGALAGGARVALAPAFVPERFWTEVRRYGVTVAFYAGDMLRELLYVQSGRGERDGPVRLLAGSGMRADTSRRLRDRFGIPRVLEFYAVVDGTSLLVNANLDKPGAAGRPLGSGARAPFLAAYSFERGEVLRDADGRCVEAADDEPGVLLYALDPQTAERIRGSGDARRIESDVREKGDLYGFSGDVMRRDPQGELWLLDRLENVIRTRAGMVLAMPVEDVFLSLPDVRAAVLLSEPGAAADTRGEPHALVCVLSVRRGRGIDTGVLSGLCRQRLSADERPARICFVDDVPLSDGGRPRRDLLRMAVSTGKGIRAELVYDPQLEAYREAEQAIAPSV